MPDALRGEVRLWTPPAPGGGSFGDGAAIVASSFFNPGVTVNKNAAPAFLNGNSYDNCLFDTAGFTGSVVAQQDIFATTDNYLAGSGQFTMLADGTYHIDWSLNTGGVGGTVPWDALHRGWLVVLRGASQILLDINGIYTGSWQTAALTSVAPHGSCDVPLLTGDVVQLKAQYIGSGNANASCQAWANLYIRQTG